MRPIRSNAGEHVMQQLTHNPVDSSRRVTRAVSVAAGLYAAVAGMVTLAGWALDIQALTDWRSDGISMFANTAACMVMCGIALLCLVGDRRGIWQIAARVLAS